MKKVSVITLLLISLFLLFTGAAADTVQVQNVQINTIGATTPVAITLDIASAGVAGYDINVSLSNPSVASITDVSFPSWAILNESSSLPASSVRLRMVDLYEQVEAGSTDVSFGSITLRGDATGSTDVVITIKEIISDTGDSLTPVLQPGKVTVDSASSEPIIADNSTTQLSRIPESALDNARSTLHIAYGHTSHGSQITTGMTGLESFTHAPYGSSTYLWSDGIVAGQLDLDDYFVDGDLGNPDRTTWAQRTREYLNNPVNSDVNVVMWSWCGQADTTEVNINTYLTLMNQLESDFPNVKFVYMTGHLNGGGEEGNLNQRNEQIRDYVKAHNKILFDFADIESYDPDGNYYGDKFATDGCNYDYNDNGMTTQSGDDPALPTNGDRNWAIDWQNSHTQGTDWYSCSPAHTQPLNANQKAYAAWWLWARLAGWDGTPVTQAPDANFSATPRSGTAPLMVQFTDESTRTPTSWNWNFGDGESSTSPNPSHEYSELGTYTVSLEVTNNEGSDSVIQTNYIAVTPGGTASRPGLFRSTNGYWYLDYNTDGVKDNQFRFGVVPGDVPLVGDWDGDGIDEPGIFRPSIGYWYLDYNTDGVTDNKFRWGVVPGDVPLVGDWDGDGTDEPGIFRPSIGYWYLDYNTDGVKDAQLTLGLSGGTPLVGDWDGDGVKEPGLFRNGNWYLDYNSDGTPDTTFRWGVSQGDIPIVGDWDGDGTDEPGIFRPSTGYWYLDYNTDGVKDTQFTFGPSGGIPLVGDWDGDGTMEPGLFKDGNWYLDYNSDGTPDTTFRWGVSQGDQPVIGNWNSL